MNHEGREGHEDSWSPQEVFMFFMPFVVQGSAG
jgi:hypothetical protein